MRQPGLQIFLAENLSFYTKGTTGAPGASQSSPEVIQKMADFREFGSLRNANQDPGNLKGDPGSKINGGNPGV